MPIGPVLGLQFQIRI